MVVPKIKGLEYNNNILTYTNDYMKLSNECNLQLMARYEDNAFDLGVIDPNYGIGEDGKKNHSRSKLAKAKKYTPKDWDSEPPPLEYFIEVQRVCKNLILWGANHYISRIPIDSSSWIVWDKENGANDFADCELALTTFSGAVRLFKFRWAGMLQGNMKNKQKRIHTTEKPYALYKWIFKNYAQEGFKILDTHLGSQSIAVGLDEMNKFDKMNLHLTGCDLDKEIFIDGVTRTDEFYRQSSIFDVIETTPENDCSQLKMNI